MTIHNNAKKEEIADVVLMGGDPLRAKWVAENYLQDAKLVSDVRGMLVFTGYYKKHRVTVMGHGMGMPSIGIYAMELFNPKFYDVKKIIRFGSSGSYDRDIKTGDIFVGDEAYGWTIFNEIINIPAKDHLLKPSINLFNSCIKSAKNLNLPIKIGRILSKDVFYVDETPDELANKFKIKVAEMEAFGLFACAQKYHKEALTILTVSNSYYSDVSMSPYERQTKMGKMVELALETAILK